MPKTESLPDQRSVRPAATRPRFQFSLFWLMAAVTVVAVVLGLGASVGPVFGIVWYAVLFLVRCAILTPLLICAIYGRGSTRVFSIGALVPWVVSFASDGQQSSILSLFLYACCSVVCGFLAIATWHWVRQISDG